MTKLEFEVLHNVTLLRADKSLIRRWMRWMVPLSTFMTFRLPFQEFPTITCSVYMDLHGHLSGFDFDLLSHELVHARQFRSWWAPWVLPLLATILPLPIIFSGRWFIEREAYLDDLSRGTAIEAAVNKLWREYAWPWPRSLMRSWFKKNLYRAGAAR